MKIYLKIILVISCCFLSACDLSNVYWDLPKFAVVETSEPDQILDVSAQCGGDVSDDGGSSVAERGLCFSITPNPTRENNKVICSQGKGNFSAKLTGLKANTTYYVRAYATTKVGTAYGNEVIFTTVNLATVTTNAASSIGLTTAICGGNISNDGGVPVSERGICYGTSHNPTTSNNKVSSGSGIGIYSTNISGLTSNTTYYVRAYATNIVGTAYGNEAVFTTASLPTLTTTTVTLITQTTAQSGGVITNIGSSNILERGICYNTTSNPTISNYKIASGSGTGTFPSSLSGLTPGTTYYIRAYAINSAGTAYGNNLSFTTSQVLLPTLTTTTASSVTTTSAVSGGNIMNDGGGAVTARGICYSTTTNPTTSNNKVASGSGNGTFTSSLSGLTPGTTYYIRAYAINSAGTAYGTNLSFTTSPVLLPTLTTTNSSSITTTSAISGGNITNDGGGLVTARGICYSTTTNPTTLNNIVAGGSGTGTFTASITGLIPGTTYYIRAYAINSAGIAYGTNLSFTTNPIFTIGQSYQGGIIFYIDGTGQHGLIAAQSDQSGGASWGCSGTTINGTSTSIGTGSANTTAIVSGCSTSGIAARLCYDLVLNSYSDWYLPSINELNLMYTNLKVRGLGGFMSTYYWSSSQYSSFSAYIQSFSSNSTAATSKSSLYRVRAIRSF